jgi:glycosyltransferase involved in cell wall biosynthesis
MKGKHKKGESMKINFITECYNHKLGGLSRYEKTLVDSLQNKVPYTLTHISSIKKPSRLHQLLYLFSDGMFKNVNALKNNDKRNNDGTITHFLNQQLALSLNVVPFNNVLVTVHDLALLLPKIRDESTFIDKIRFYFLKRGLKKADWFVVDAAFTKKELIRLLGISPEKIFIVPLGVDLKRFKRKKLGERKLKKYRGGSSGPVILYVGSELRRMNFATLLKAFALVKREYPQATLIKIGEAKSKQGRINSLNLIKKLKLNDAIQFKDYVSEEDLVYYYNAADVFVYPISYTGYGLPILESLACGCPVVTTSASTIPEVVGDAGLLFDPYDVKKLKENIFSILGDKKLRNHLQKKGYSHVKKLTWDACSENTLSLYKHLLNSSR